MDKFNLSSLFEQKHSLQKQHNPEFCDIQNKNCSVLILKNVGFQAGEHSSIYMFVEFIVFV